jgi:hypothetical protein
VVNFSLFFVFFFFLPFDLGDIIALSTTVGERAFGLGGCCGDDVDVILVATVAEEGSALEEDAACLLLFASSVLLSPPSELVNQFPHPHPDDSLFILLLPARLSSEDDQIAVKGK